MAYSSRLNWPWIALLCSLFKRGIQLHSHGFNLVLFFLLNVSLHLSVMSLPFNPTRRVLRCALTASNLILRQIVWRRIFFFQLNIVSIFSLQCHSTFIFFIGIFSILVEFMMTCKPLFKFDIKWLDYMPNIVDSLDTLESSVCVNWNLIFIEFLSWNDWQRLPETWLCSLAVQHFLNWI
jgi:hypothetical protein